MKKRMLIVLTIVILIIALISVLLVINRLNNNIKIMNEEDEELIDAETGNKIEAEINSTLNNVTNRNDYYVVETCVNRFFIYYSSIYDPSDEYVLIEELIADTEEESNDGIQEVYNMLDKEYIKTREITKDNLKSKLNEIRDSRVNISKMYVQELTKEFSIYLVYGTLRDKDTSNLSGFAIMVKIDENNKTYSVFLQDYIDENYSNLEIGRSIEFNNVEPIEINNYNVYEYESISDETYIGDLFNKLRDELLFYRQTAYERLNEEYKTKRFTTFEKFEQYIKDNIKNITVMKLSKYQKNVNEDSSVQYICLDSEGNYYIIDEISTMNCEFILDTYTIDLPEFLTKYEETKYLDKVALNIEKIKEAINFKDFEYVYNKTDDTFKSTKFKNFEEFENYLKSKLFEENTFEYKNIEEQGNIYVATVIITDKNSTNKQSKEMKVIMKLTDTTDYRISFNFE